MSNCFPLDFSNSVISHILHLLKSKFYICVCKMEEGRQADIEFL